MLEQIASREPLNITGALGALQGLPTQTAEWPIYDNPQQSLSPSTCIKAAIERCAQMSPWRWPSRPIFFVSDVHADAEAFTASLLASGGVQRPPDAALSFSLTKVGQHGTFVIGGDCLDKGPSNLKLLQRIRHLMDSGARVKLLAGNHDVRLLMGLRALELKRHPLTEHLFLRMGPKVVPLLQEVHEQYLQDTPLQGIPSRKECRRRLFPSERWYKKFPKLAAASMSPQLLDKELKRIAKKQDVFEESCAEAGLNLRQVYATGLKCRELFLHPNGEYSWFFERMQLVYRAGSFLFLHAGLDDCIASMLLDRGEAYLNQLYQRQTQADLFEFYYGPLANTMRTKYREVDRPLTDKGVEAMGRRGVHVVVHGHRNRTSGQSIALRQGLIHIEGDITLDRNSRRKEGLAGFGVGVTIIRPEGQVIGISNDYPFAKVFEPERYLQPAGIL